MQIAARNAFTTGGWANPYVTNGLVAMWDFVWNMGQGTTQDTSSRVCYDHVSRLPFVLGENALTFSQGGLSKSGVGSFLSVSPGGGSSYGWNYAEVVVSVDTAASYNTPVVVIFGKRFFWLNVSASLVGFTQNNSATWRTAGFAIQNGAPFSVASVFDDESFETTTPSSIYVNCISSTHDGVADSWGNNKIANGSIGVLYNVTASYLFVGTYHAIRLYSRALTAAEMAANYAIDKARFNLP